MPTAESSISANMIAWIALVLAALAAGRAFSLISMREKLSASRLPWLIAVVSSISAVVILVVTAAGWFLSQIPESWLFAGVATGLVLRVAGTVVYQLLRRRS